MKTIGILGGLGPESTAACYTAITRRYYELRGDYAYPEIVVYSLNFKDFIDSGYEMPERVREGIEKLSRAGADFAIAPCNSVHIVYEEASKQLPIPWVSIMDSTAEEIRREGMRRVGLLGTIFTMTKGFYQRALTRHGIETITPEAATCNKLNRIIYDELVRNVITDASRKYVLECVEELARAGAQGVVLGCTELPFIAQQADTKVRLFDTTASQARHALDLALEKRA